MIWHSEHCYDPPLSRARLRAAVIERMVVIAFAVAWLFSDRRSVALFLKYLRLSDDDVENRPAEVLVFYDFFGGALENLMELDTSQILDLDYGIAA